MFRWIKGQKAGIQRHKNMVTASFLWVSKHNSSQQSEEMRLEVIMVSLDGGGDGHEGGNETVLCFGIA
jgi:hypothetical protein